MKIGDRVQSLIFRTAVHGFPEKHTEPDQKEISQGAIGTVEQTWSSGWGIIHFDCGIRLLARLDKDFIKIEW